MGEGSVFPILFIIADAVAKKTYEPVCMRERGLRSVGIGSCCVFC
jgi:hypothetical protein